MTIIRNDRRQREAREHEAAASREASEEEESVDLRWHPTEDELPNPISCERWEALLKDPTVFDEDGMHAVDCLNDYGGPATLQQLSVKYRGTMGRYRKWLNGVAERAARHEGRESLGTDQFGREEWWPYLYRQRIVGKAAANVYEMLLQPELQEALRRRDAAETAERKRQEAEAAEAVRARNAEKRKAQLEAAAKAQEAAKAQAAREAEERQRAKVAAAAAQRASEPAHTEASAPAAGRRADDAPARPSAATSAGRGGVVLDLPETPAASQAQPAGARASQTAPQGATARRASVASGGRLDADDALVSFLITMEGIEREAKSGSGKAPKASRARSAQGRSTSWRPLDYAHRYADRLADAFELIAAGLPELTVARVARELGDESVEELAGYLNGSSVPGFAYLGRLCDLLLVDEQRLEAPDSRAADLPVFCTLRERFGAEDAARRVWDQAQQIVFLTDDSPSRRSGIVVRFSDLSCALLERGPVNADADRHSDPALSAYVRLVREVDNRAEGGSLSRSARKVSAKEWDALAAGQMWPGLFC